MATLENIRKKGPLLAIIIGFALLAFVLGDALRSGKGLFTDSQNLIGEISGEGININTYQAKLNNLLQIYQIQSGQQPTGSIRERYTDLAWDQLVREQVMSIEYQELGLNVADDELDDLIRGNNIDPMVRRLFQNPETGQIDRNQITQFIQTLDQRSAQEKAYWLYIESEVLKNRLNSKYNALVSKGLYVTTAEAEAEKKERNLTVDINYVVQKYNSIADDKIEVSESDVSDYYNKNKETFKQEATRDVVYIPFAINPSEKDRELQKEKLEEIKSKFDEDTEPGQFLKLFSDIPYKAKYLTKEDLSKNIDTLMFSADINFIFGPYEENGSYKVAKLISKTMVPDSAKARHILIQPTKEQDMARSKEIADSLLIIIKKDTSLFTSLAAQYSTDPGSKDKGGLYDWFEEGKMVKEFNDKCFFGKVGEIDTVVTQFGIHIIEVLGQKEASEKVQVAIVEKKIIASEETKDLIYAQASEFAGKNNTPEAFEKAANDQGLTKRIASYLKEMDKYVPGLESPRPLVKWAYKAEKNTVSEVFNFETKFVVGILTEIREAGIAPIEQVKNQIIGEVRKDKKAKQLVEKISADTKGTSTLADLAQKLNSEVDTALNVRFSPGYGQLPGAGIEPSVVATAVNMKQGAISTAIEGKSGVYVIEVTNINAQEATTGIANERMSLASSIRTRTSGNSYEALKKLAEIEDYRSRFQ